MSSRPSTLPRSLFTSLVGKLGHAWARFVADLNRRMDAHPLPRHHRLGAWQRSIFPEPVGPKEKEPMENTPVTRNRIMDIDKVRFREGNRLTEHEIQ